MQPSILQLGTQLRAGETTVMHLVDECLAQIERLEPELRAWVLVDAEGARREAQRLQAELAAGTDRGPLHGIPLGIKDLIDVEGWPTRAGSPLTDRAPARHDAPLIQRLRQAGAVLLGKTVTTEWAAFDPPVTRNPWQRDRTPGGSSSGSAVAVATGMCVAALGSQTGGSIIRPASFCGVAGFKPSYGRVPVMGVVPFAWHLDHVGPIARCSADLQLIAQAIGDWHDQPLGMPASIAKQFLVYHALAVGEASADVVAVWERACHELAAATSAPPQQTVGFPADFRDVLAAHRCVMEFESAQFHRTRYEQHADQFGPRMGSVVAAGLGLLDTDFEQARRQQEVFRAAVAEQLGEDRVALMPATTTTAPTAETTGDPRFNSPWSFAGAPTVTLPCGLAADGLPVGLQLIAAPGRDDLVLQTAHWCEQQLRTLAATVHHALSN
jgi:Asp-tRNA(Asn)/Glu-tRNA(Gln) amidotransferase A subunit family amidase